VIRKSPSGVIATPANYAVNASVLASRRLQGKRRAPRPARYRGRWTDDQNRTVSQAHHSSEHLPAGRLRSVPGSGRFGAASRRRKCRKAHEPSAPTHHVAVPRAGRNFECGALAMPILLVRWLPRKRRTLHAFVNRRAVIEGGVAARVLEVKDLLSNKPMNPTHFAASRRLRAQAARRGSRAGYRRR